jgi:hypothetical protein
MAQDQSHTQIVREGFERACKAFTERMQPSGFARSKKTFWTRHTELTADFIHFHRNGISYGPATSASVSIRVHLGIRVLNDCFEATALNGPYSDPGGYQRPVSPGGFKPESQHPAGLKNQWRVA